MEEKKKFVLSIQTKEGVTQVECDPDFKLPIDEEIHILRIRDDDGKIIQKIRVTKEVFDNINKIHGSK